MKAALSLLLTWLLWVGNVLICLGSRKEVACGKIMKEPASCGLQTSSQCVKVDACWLLLAIQGLRLEKDGLIRVRLGGDGIRVLGQVDMKLGLCMGGRVGPDEVCGGRTKLPTGLRSGHRRRHGEVGGYRGISLMVRARERTGRVVVSPVQGSEDSPSSERGAAAAVAVPLVLQQVDDQGRESALVLKPMRMLRVETEGSQGGRRRDEGASEGGAGRAITHPQDKSAFLSPEGLAAKEKELRGPEGGPKC